jgi:NADH-quinone oxidoreductase subunit J
MLPTMSALQLVFLTTAVVTVIAALMVVVSRRLVHAALWLILALAGVAVVFVLLEAGFLAVVQVAVYIGAIAILIIFAVMLTRRVMTDTGRQENANWWVAALVAAGLFAGLAVLILQMPSLGASAPALPGSQETLLQQLGESLVDVNHYVVPFELASVLLLAAMIGAIVIALPVEHGGEGRR